MDTMVEREINSSYCLFESLTKRPQDYLSYQENIIDTVKGLVKNLYDITKRSEKKIVENTALPELIVDSFDEEQIWQELELQNNDWNSLFKSETSKLIVNKDTLLFPVNNNDSGSEDTVNKRIDHVKLKETGNTHTDSGSDKSNCDEIDTVNFDGDGDVDSGSECSVSSVEHQAVGKNEKSKVEVQGRWMPSEVDDKFFKLSEMERFMEIEEQKGSSKSNLHDSDSDIDYFADDLEDEGYSMETQEGGADYKYEDFFAPPDDLNKTEVGHARLESGDEESDTEENINSDISDSEDDTPKEEKSSFEERQERLQNKIRRLEEEALQEKPWQLSGEVVGSARPQNSLLEEFVDFDVITRPAPIITEETTMRLEDIILLRIKDKSWDDVERKIKPVDTVELFKKPFVLDQEKSKLSLAEVYEQEYLKQRDSLVVNKDEYNEKKETESQLHSEVRAMMTSLFNKLDALSNFHCTPRPVIPELKVVSNIPAINMEEVAPVAVSNSTLLAPEEIQGNSFKKVINKNEQTITDKRRALRNKKKRQKRRAKEMMKKNLPVVGKQGSYNSNTLRKNKSENKIDASSKTSSSSKKFFSDLQEVNNSVKRKVKLKTR